MYHFGVFCSLAGASVFRGNGNECKTVGADGVEVVCGMFLAVFSEILNFINFWPISVKNS